MKEAKESHNEGRAARQKGVRKVQLIHSFLIFFPRFDVIFLQLNGQRAKREALMSRANSLKKAVRQIIEHAERALDEQNAIHHPSSHRHSASASQTSGCGGMIPDIKLVVTHPDDPSPEAATPDDNRKEPNLNPVSAKTAAMPMALLQLYSAISGGAGGGDSSSEPSPCPSPIPVAPSLTTNFPLLPTSPIRYPNPPVFYRMANPPNMLPQRPRSSCDIRATSPRPPVPYVCHQESAESEGDDDRSAILSLQVSSIHIENETNSKIKFNYLIQGEVECHIARSGRFGDAYVMRIRFFGSGATGAAGIRRYGQSTRRAD